MGKGRIPDERAKNTIPSATNGTWAAGDAQKYFTARYLLAKVRQIMAGPPKSPIAKLSPMYRSHA
jgi:hypothetical protein